MSDPNLLSQKFGIAPLPDSVVRLGKLVMKRDADVEEIIKVIKTDNALTERLLRAANTGGRTDIETVDQAVFRTGVGCLLLLAMSEPLIRAVTNTFSTMASINLEPVDPIVIGPINGGQFVGSATFAGKANGVVYIRLKDSFAAFLTSQVLGTKVPAEIRAGVTDLLKELVNMVVGNFKSNLVDAGLSCKLGLPQVARVTEFTPPTATQGRHQVFTFRFNKEPVIMDVVVEATE